METPLSVWVSGYEKAGWILDKEEKFIPTLPASYIYHYYPTHVTLPKYGHGALNIRRP